MSVTVEAVPFLLFFTMSRGIIEIIKNEIQLSIPESVHINEETYQKLFNKEFETNIVDYDTLLKTLKEHNAVNILESRSEISCDCENFHLDFYKKAENFFYMTITYKTENGMKELIENIDAEYKINAQEISYNKIKERLEEQNLNIAEEEIYDDNTIVLTVNLE